jgi:FkbM family methyltransferase
MNTKIIAQYLLKKFGLRLSRITVPEPVAPFDLLDVVIQARLRTEGRAFYFIQIEANDGILADSLNPLIRRYGLQGCLVEPMKDLYEDLIANYSDQPQLDFRNSLISDSDGYGEIYRFKRDAPVPAFFHGLARDDFEYIKKRAISEGVENYIEMVKVETQSFSSLLKSLDAPSISLLYVDTKGSDDKVIYSAFSCGLYPPVIQYEWSEMSPERCRQLKMTLLDNGYRFIDVAADTICLRLECE